MILKSEMKLYGFLFFASIITTLPSPLFSQSTNKTISREKAIYYEKYLNSKDCSIHTSIKPLLNPTEKDTLCPLYKPDMNDDLVITPIINSSYNRDDNTSITLNHFQLEGGVAIGAVKNNKLSLNLTFLSGSSSFPSFIDSTIKRFHIIPGMGIAHQNKEHYSYQYYSGYMSYSPNSIFNFQIGRDKSFFGDGYRSLFLSDVSNPYPFFKLSTTVWKIKYVSLFALLKDVSTSMYHHDFKNKYGTFHYLSWNASKRINLSVFESIVWQGSDSNRVRYFDVNYLNPVIFYRPVEYSLGSSDNSFLGVGFKVKVGRKYSHQFYGQIILDEFLLSEIKAMNGWWGNKQGVQLGYKYFDVFGIKNLQFQTEVNSVRPYTYSHGSPQQNYAHYNQALAHPLGANFSESVSFLNYHFNRWFLEAEFLYAYYGKNYMNTNYGGNIFESYYPHPKEYGNKIGQGLKTTLTYSQYKIAYTLIPSMDMIAEVGFAVRKEDNYLSPNSAHLFFIALKTRWINRYSDY